MEELTKIWSRFKTNLRNIALGISGVSYRIFDIRPEEGELGYTSANKTIHLAYSHPIIDALNTLEERLMFIKGVFAHELMHQLETDFLTFETKVEALPKHHQKIFATIFNVMEDPAIEYWAPEYFGGHFLSALHYSVKICYKNASEVSLEASPFSQFLQAAIHYGDGGFVKGTISDKKAQEIFYQVLPLFDECIVCPSGTERVLLAEEVFRLTKPLWEEEAKNMKKMEELIEEIMSILEEAGKNQETGSGDGPSGMASEKGEGGDSESEKKMSRRAKTSSKAGKDSGKDSGSDGDADGEGSSGSGSEKANSDGEGDSNDTDSDTEYCDDFMHAKNGSSEGDPMNHSGGENEEVSDGVIEDAEYELTDSDIEAIKEEVEACLNGVELDEKEAQDVDVNFDIPDMKECYPRKSCINLTIPEMKGNFEMQYASLLESMAGGINHLTHQLKRIFQNDVETKEYRQSGRINVKRLQSSRMTSRLFDRRVAPDNKHDACVMLVVDVSGSMYGSKAMLAKQAAIGLAEVFNNLHIPFKVMTFSADNSANGRNWDAVHTHYVNWSSSRSERVKLLNIAAGGNNFDGYSITYAGKLIGKRKESHKLMIVISDGQPACSSYYSKDGIVDTKNAVKSAKKHANVIGVSIDADSEIIYSFYGDRFVEIKNIETLFERLGGVIQKEIKSW